MVEIWKPVKGYEGLYEVSNLGNVKALKRTVNKGKCHRTWDEHILKTAIDGCGYFRTNLARNGTNKTFKVHRLVVEAFIPNPENKPTVNHINGDKTDNRVENLEWATQNEQMKHACDMNLKRCDGEHNSAHKLTFEEVKWIREHHIPRDSQFGSLALAARFGVHRKTISRIVNNKTWKVGDANVYQVV